MFQLKSYHVPNENCLWFKMQEVLHHRLQMDEIINHIYGRKLGNIVCNSVPYYWLYLAGLSYFKPA
jgi:hypothetical protein